MKLWHMHSETLKGFYASEVFAAGEDETTAIEAALRAYDYWLAEQIREYLIHPLVNMETDEDGYELEARKVREAFHSELKGKLKSVPRHATIFRSV